MNVQTRGERAVANIGEPVREGEWPEHDPAEEIPAPAEPPVPAPAPDREPVPA